ncbi:MAG: glycosyltransferase family 2 protein [Patescibacteria group bacterium]
MDKNFTIILPTYNEEKTIVKTITQALLTSASEVIVVNDGSTDATVSLLLPIIKNNPRLKIISHLKNKGCGVARKNGIIAASNPILLFFDSDIENINSKMMNKLVKPILKNEADFVIASFENFGRITEYLIKPLFSEFVPNLAHLKQPISGMFAVRRSYLDYKKINPGHSMASILLNTYFKAARIKEVDIGLIIHKHRSDLAKCDQARTECNSIIKSLLENKVLYR